jgi:hypothetical protein
MSSPFEASNGRLLHYPLNQLLAAYANNQAFPEAPERRKENLPQPIRMIGVELFFAPCVLLITEADGNLL